jgi:RNA polymerase sigma factor (sigma-70 family)
MTGRDSIPTRGSLLGRIRDPDNNLAWTEFSDTYKKLVWRLAMKAGLTGDEADDVVQEVFISMSRNIGTFEYDPAKCSFKHWLSQMVRWRIQDQFRKRKSVGPLAAMEHGVAECGSPGIESAMAPELEAVWEAEWKQHLIDAAAARVKRRVSAKQFQIFFLNVLRDMPAADVAQRLKVTRTQVYMAKMYVSRLFRKELEAVSK